MIYGKIFWDRRLPGEANEVLTVEHAFKVGRFLGWYYGQDHKAKIVIGKDTRRRSTCSSMRRCRTDRIRSKCVSPPRDDDAQCILCDPDGEF